ncbi:CHASE2 domain-containing protein [Erythrobacter sp. W53]|uniref:CHASE2 domain-containing protein n=1 Tax=Erythrobacter sp. W53 TaxID=3425947 RepID=UPI003D767A93
MTTIFARGWRSVREAGPRRLLITALLISAALFLARFGWGIGPSDIPAVTQAERELYDSRYYVYADRNPIEQDDRIVLIVYNDQTLIETRKRSPLDRGVLARSLQQIDTMGAKAIGIDMLFDQPQDEDPELIETLRAMQTPVAVGYADTVTNEGSIVYDQQQYLDEFVGALEGSNATVGSVRLNDRAGVTRRWSEIRPDVPPLLGRAMLRDGGDADKLLEGYEGSVRYRLTSDDTVPVFTSLPIQLFADPEMAAGLASFLEGRYVLIGGDIVDIDRVTTPLTNAMGGRPEALAETGLDPPGILVHAEMVAQMLDQEPLPGISPVILWVFAVLIVLLATLTGLLEWGNWRIYLLLAVQFGAIIGAPFLLQMQGVDTYGVPAAGWLLGWIIAFSAVTSTARAAGAVQRNFAQGALGKYLPREMASEIIDKPELLALHGEKKEIYVLFSDLEGFTKMSHAIAPEMVAKLLNRYLEMLSQVVLDHGGVIDKFVGDAVVAFWGAPIAKDDDGERAAKAGYAVWQAGEAFRAEVAAMDPDLPKVGKTRVGLHFGEAVVGNFGGDTRIQYTALGDSMNTAARLEAANKALESSVMASREFAECSGIKWWRAMGRVRLRGRAQPVDLMEPAPDFPSEDAAKLIEASAVAERYPSTAVNLVEEVAGRYPDDTALQNLLKRLGELDETGTFNLG